MWVLLEIVCMSLFYTIYTLSLSVNDGKDIVATFKSSTVNTALVLLLPYITLWFYFGWEESKKKLENIEQSEPEDENLPNNYSFTDEKGVLRLSVQSRELLYLESDDNYVVIHYAANGKVKRYLLRNTLKNLESQFADTPVVRCHRSFLVNFGRVKVMRRERDGLFLELDAEGEKDIPVSKSYRDKVGEKFISQSFKSQK
jgi:DNA-binding LytR/AlgR family response regulator